LRAAAGILGVDSLAGDILDMAAGDILGAGKDTVVGDMVAADTVAGVAVVVARLAALSTSQAKLW